MNVNEGAADSETYVASDAIKDTLRAFLQRAAGEVVIRDDDDIFESGFVNSMYAMELMLFMENEWSILIGGDDIDIENFSSISKMTKFINAKTAPQSAPQ